MFTEVPLSLQQIKCCCKGAFVVLVHGKAKVLTNVINFKEVFNQ